MLQHTLKAVIRAHGKFRLPRPPPAREPRQAPPRLPRRRDPVTHRARPSRAGHRHVSRDPSPGQPIRAGRGPAATLLFRLTRPPASPSARHPSVVDAGEEPGGAVMAEPAERAALELPVPLVLEKGAPAPPGAPPRPLPPPLLSPPPSPPPLLLLPFVLPRKPRRGGTAPAAWRL